MSGGPAMGADLAMEQELAGRGVERHVFRRLFGFLRGGGKRLSIVLGAEVLLVLTIVGRPWFFRYAMDDGFALDGDKISADQQVLIWAALGLVAMWTARFALVGLSQYHSGNLAIDVLGSLRRRLSEHVHALSVRYFDRTKVGRIVARADRDVDSLEPILIYGLPAVLATVTRFGSAVVLLAIIAPGILLWLLPLLPTLALAIIIFKRAGTRLWGHVAEAKSRVTAHLVETITGVRVIQQAVHESGNRASYDGLLSELDRRAVRGAFGWAWFQPFTFVLFTLGMVVVLVKGGQLVADDAITVGELTQCLFYVFLFLGPLVELGDLFERGADANAAAQRIFLLLDTEPEVRDADDARELDQVRGEIAYNAVSFAYDPQETERFVLTDFNLSIPAGQTLAVVGPTGHGKSTMVQLLARFYDVQKGSITLDGHDLRSLSQHSLRQHIGVVLQDNVLFSGTILDNLRFARPGADESTLIAACRELGADHVLERLPDGYATEVGPEGRNLSHGCRQLVCLVRASLADPAVLVLDEATSAVDLHTERRLQRALRTLTAGRTAIVIAHRLSTIRDADRIIMIRDGRIVEDGSHDELVARGGAYAELHEAYRRGEGGDADAAGG
ncbi:MAG: ABC transporter ATP-binding protein [Planctomycetota bacterium]|jgi:ATP-binding cassette subfamily B protein|nr:ABC transporter ATP-binding protein [Planctomycetota bacterium]